MNQLPGGSDVPDPDAPWIGLQPETVVGLFDALAMPWWVAGGWALELAVGRSIRPHVDLDIAVPRGAQPRLLALVMAGWEFFVAHDGALTAWDGSSLVAPQHQFWVREPGGPRWAFEVLLEDIDDVEWRYRRDPSIMRPAAEFGARTASGVPYVTPEITLLYKSSDPAAASNALDFEATVPALSDVARAWLRAAIASQQAEHPWLARL